MDVAGAETLRWRIEQQQHWRRAAAVCDGRQPAVDPDSEELERVADGIRVYGARVTNGETVHLCKRLVDGVWEHGLAGPQESRDDSVDDPGDRVRRLSVSHV